MSGRKNRIAIFASGSGTNAEELFKYFKDHPTIEIALLLSNNPQAYALQRARNFSVDAKVFDRTQFRESTVVIDWLKEKQITHIVLAGFMWLVPPYLIQAFPDHIVNIHPALLPDFGGKGMYGMFVHEAVKKSNRNKTGITIHLVNEKYDDGRILAQESCLLDAQDTPDDIANKVHKLEHYHYPRVVEKWILEE